MHYNVCLIGTKDTTILLAKHIMTHISPIDCIITIDGSRVDTSRISGYSPITEFAGQNGIALFEAPEYSLRDEVSAAFFKENTFDLGICMGWQRLIPPEVLARFQFGVFGFHGSCGYLPYGRGRSPLNWSIINGDRRFILNLFQYDEKADSPNVFQNRMFEINPFDTIRTLQYKNLLCSYDMVGELIQAYRRGTIPIRRDSCDFDSLYPKRTPQDGKISFEKKTAEIYNLVRGVTRPFPGAFCSCEKTRQTVTVWDAVPFDGILCFSAYCPGQVIDLFDGMPVVRTVDGSLLIRQYDCAVPLTKGDVLV